MLTGWLCEFMFGPTNHSQFSQTVVALCAIWSIQEGAPVCSTMSSATSGRWAFANASGSHFVPMMPAQRLLFQTVEIDTARKRCTVPVVGWLDVVAIASTSCARVASRISSVGAASRNSV